MEAPRALSTSDAHKEALGAVGRFSSSTAYKAFAATIPAFASAFPIDTLERTAQAIAEANRIAISKIGAITGSSAPGALDFSKFSIFFEQIRTIHTSTSGHLVSDV